MSTDTYTYSSKARLTDHFTADEFRCKCGRGHDTILDPALPVKLEKLREVLRCKAITVTSGYRCPAHDKAVGGNGAGMHTKGLAADIVCTGQDGKTIDSRTVCCAAQDSGFGGIGRISNSATHVDIRTSNFWRGDETVPGGTSSSVTSDYYKYFGITKSDVYGSSPKSGTLTLDGKTFRVTIEEM